jgi:flagellin-like hook-associated protein FlgL
MVLENLDTGVTWASASVAYTTAGASIMFGAGSVAIGTAAGWDTAGDSVEFEFISAGEFKYELRDKNNDTLTLSSGTVAVGSNTWSKEFAYAAASASVDTGAGVSFNAEALSSLADDETVWMNYTKAMAVGESDITIDNAAEAASLLTVINNAIDTVSSSMSALGASMSTLTVKEEAVSIAQINVEASYNRIMNADMAMEQLEATKLTILQQTAITMLAQANTAPQSVLQLFR